MVLGGAKSHVSPWWQVLLRWSFGALLCFLYFIGGGERGVGVLGKRVGFWGIFVKFLTLSGLVTAKPLGFALSLKSKS